MYRGRRRQGETVRTLTDCLIGATAIRASVSVLHSDGDFEVLARHTALTLDERTFQGLALRSRPGFTPERLGRK